MPRRPPSRPRPSPRFCKVATCGARRRPAPARPPHFPCRCCSAWPPNAPVAAPRARLVLVPTRELAAQVGETMRSLAQHLPERLKIAIAFGGVSINPQMMGLRGGADIVVATPGRLLDLVEHNALKLDAVAMLVLDEADRLFDLGFAEELGRILALLPRQRQNLLFSATFPPAIQALADGMLRDPAVIDVQGEPGTEPNIVQRVIEVDAIRRTQLLRHLLKDERRMGPRAGVRRHAAFGADRGREALQERHLRGALPRRHRAGHAHRHPVAVQGEPMGRGDRHRPGGARHRHRAAARGHQLRPAALADRLHPPHRPHRAARAKAAWRSAS
jgi:hypothetical protein